MGDVDFRRERGIASERGNTLVEVLIAVVILGLTVTAVLGNLLTTTSVSEQHRNTANFGAALASFAETTRNTIELQAYNGSGTGPQYSSCASGYTLVGDPIPSSGPPGTVVTVLGTGFSPTAGVFSGATFNGSSAGFTSHASASSGPSGDIAQFTVPNVGVGVYSVTPFDGSHRAATSFTVTAPPAASAAQTIGGDALSYDTFNVTCTTESANVEQLQFDLADTRPNNGSGARQIIDVVNMNPQGLSAPPISVAAAPPTFSPAPPTGITGQLNVTWYPPTYQGLGTLNSFKVYRSTTSGGPWGSAVGSVLSSSCAPQCSYTDPGPLNNGTVYYYEVTAITSTGESQPSTQASGTTLPGKPGTPTPTSGTGQVSLSWSAPANGDAPISGYNVYCSTTSGSIGAKVNPTPISGTSYTDSTCNGAALADGNYYYFEITALNAGGEGPPSAQATGITLPGTPQAVAATPTGTAISVSWTPPANGNVPIIGYNVYCSTTSGTQGSRVNSPSGSISGSPYTVPSCNGAPLLPTQTYWFEVTAVNAGGEGTPSSQVGATVGAPSAPQNLSGSASKVRGNWQVTLSWQPPTSGGLILGYNVYCSTTQGTQGSKVNTSGYAASPYTVTSCNGSALANGTPYYFTVTAVNAYGEGAPASISVTP
jgi:type II secretory pathway pseudopilin PulG